MYKIVSILFCVALFTSCKKSLPDVGGTAAQSMANEWWVTMKLGGVDQLGTHVKIKTYNTSANGNQIWIDDFPNATTLSGNVWGFQVKANADFNNMTFSANNSVSAVTGYAIKVNVANGKVFPKGGNSKSGVSVDSIYMKIEFEDDPGNVYELSGHERTKLIEDEY